ncbi:hypothetical protein [Endozoicomonas sp. Mp262]|uniref:hypothetical protein n=1 Tax=Endozoicomonas sp. Mp262 TaxID=2919499 RepID=UPI0021D92CDE
MKTELMAITAQSVSELAAKPAADLMALSRKVRAELDRIKSLMTFIEGAIDYKYSDDVVKLRTESGKENGVVHLQDAGVKVSADLPKRVSWDQKQLKAIAEKIAAQGGDPTEYLDVTYKVAERKYTAWPESIRKAFEPARTLKTGKPVYKLSDAEESQG